MNDLPRSRSQVRFTLVMVAAFPFVFVGLFYFTTMQAAKSAAVMHSDDFSSVGFKVNSSFWAGHYQQRVLLWDSESGRKQQEWVTKADVLWPTDVESPSGEMLRRLNRSDYFRANGRDYVTPLAGDMQLIASSDSCEVIDRMTGKKLSHLRSDGRPVWVWAATGSTVTCIYCDTPYMITANFIVGAEVFDAESGKKLHRCDLQLPVDGSLAYCEKFDRFLYFSKEPSIHWIKPTGQVERVVSPTRHWPMMRGVMFSLAGLWWLVWSLQRRCNDRSWRPMLDIFLLHLAVFVCSAARFWAYAYGPDWSGYLHVWESVAFIGSGLSIVAWTLFWIVFGSNRWPVRFGLFVVGIAIVVAAIIVIWDAGSDAGRYDASLARAQTSIGSISLISVILVLFVASFAKGARLCHFVDQSDTNYSGGGKQTTIRDMFAWMVAFGLLFAIFQLRNLELPKVAEILQLMMTGLVGGSVGVMTLWIGLGRPQWRFLLAIFPYCIAVVYFQAINRMEILHVGCAWLPMLLVSSLALRWNGYTWGEPEPFIETARSSNRSIPNEREAFW